jgi:hypothetical protein
MKTSMASNLLTREKEEKDEAKRYPGLLTANY